MSQQERRLLIGRAGECDVVLDDPSVSRRHAELVFTPQGQWLLVDRRSQNGTSVGSGDQLRRITQEIITPAHTVQFGDLRIAAEELLRRAKLKVPAPVVAPPRPVPTPAPAPVAVGPQTPATPPGKPWVRATRLIRCNCGAVKPKGGTCPECRE